MVYSVCIHFHPQRHTGVDSNMPPSDLWSNALPQSSREDLYQHQEVTSLTPESDISNNTRKWHLYQWQEVTSLPTTGSDGLYLCSFLRLFSSSWRTFFSWRKSWCFSSWRPWSFSPIFIIWSFKEEQMLEDNTDRNTQSEYHRSSERWKFRPFVLVPVSTCSLVSSKDILSSISFFLFLSSSSFSFCSIILSTSSSSVTKYRISWFSRVKFS